MKILDENLNPVVPEKPMHIMGDEKFTYVKLDSNGNIVFTLTDDFIKRFEYMEKVVKCLTASNRVKYPRGYPE